MSATDARHMRHALSLGRRGLGSVAPWPSVGCVIVKNGHVVGRGTSDQTSVRHAEVVALQQAGESARGGTVYVTLEPCSHHGSTPPCADALIAAGVARVVVAARDPNPQVAGQGIQRLRDAGIQLDQGLLEAEARADHAGFLSVLKQKRPYLTLKLAMTLDGRIATASGESRWITGAYARRAVHAMRLRHDAVLVGGGTARADDPTLTVRELGGVHQPIRVVASRRIKLPWPNKLAASIDEAPVWLAHSGADTSEADIASWRDIGAKFLDVDVKAGHLDPVDLLAKLGGEGVTRVLCEGGGTLAASLLGAGMVDELVIFTAGKVIGAEGQPGIAALGFSALADCPEFELVDLRTIGGDVMQVWKKPNGGSAV